MEGTEKKEDENKREMKFSIHFRIRFCAGLRVRYAFVVNDLSLNTEPSDRALSPKRAAPKGRG